MVKEFHSKIKVHLNLSPEFNSATNIGRSVLPKSTHNLGGKVMGKLKRDNRKNQTKLVLIKI